MHLVCGFLRYRFIFRKAPLNLRSNLLIFQIKATCNGIIQNQSMESIICSKTHPHHAENETKFLRYTFQVEDDLPGHRKSCRHLRLVNQLDYFYIKQRFNKKWVWLNYTHRSVYQNLWFLRFYCKVFSLAFYLFVLHFCLLNNINHNLYSQNKLITFCLI